jgi:hypothetical protein
MRKGKRTISKSKTYGFQPWADQIDAINVIIAKTGAKEATILRKLVDEALAARRSKDAKIELEETPATTGIAATLETIETLLLKIIRQGDTSLRTQDISLALLQDTLAEARAGRRVAWQSLTSGLKDEGLSPTDINDRFEKETAEAKRFAYGVAKEIKDEHH